MVLVWVAALAMMIWNWQFWSEGFFLILAASSVTLAGTVALSRYWIRHKSRPSFGSIVTPPLVCACLLIFGTLFYSACRDGDWDTFTLSYWAHTKGGFTELLFPLIIVWLVCLFPAAAVVIYFQRDK